MKHSIYDLKVVRVSNNSNYYYFICRETLSPNTYKEVLSGKKIVARRIEDVESLSHYYSILESCNYKTGKVLTIGKKEIISKTISINVYHARNKNEVNNKEVVEASENNILNFNNEKLSPVTRLELATESLFPKSGSWNSGEFVKSPHSLIQHLRDSNWLASKLQSMGLKDIDFLRILDYVETNAFFIDAREEYEQRIVKWQIDYMKNGGEGWLVPEGYGGDFVQFNPNCDIAFRKGVVNTLSAIGIDISSIEFGLESNAEMWRLSEMESAYHNTYYPVFTNVTHNDIPEDIEHKEKWLQLRLYEYYQEHKESVDKYGEVTEKMRISKEEAEELKTYLAIAHEEKIAEIERVKEKNKNKGEGIKLKPVDYFA